MAAPHIDLISLMQQPSAKGIAHAAAASLAFVIGVPWVMQGAPIPHYGSLIGGSPKPVANIIDVPTILGPNTPIWGIFGHPDTFCTNRYLNPELIAGATAIVVKFGEVTPSFDEQDKTACPSFASIYSGTTVPITDSIFTTPKGASHLRPLLYLAVPLFFVWVLGKLISKAYNKLLQDGPIVVPPVVINVAPPVQPIQPNREQAVRQKFFYKWREILRSGQIDWLESQIRNLEREKKAKFEGRMSREKEIFDRKLADRDILHQGRALRSQKEIDTLQKQKDDLQNQLDTNHEPCAASRKELEASLEKTSELCATYKRLNELNLKTIEILQTEIDTNACQLEEDRKAMNEAELRRDQDSHELQLEVIRITKELSGVEGQKLESDRHLQQAQKEKAELNQKIKELDAKRQQEAENAERKHRKERTSLQAQCKNQLASTNTQHETTLQSKDDQLKSLEQATKAARDQHLQNIDILKEQHRMQLKREISKEVAKALADQKAELDKEKANTKSKNASLPQTNDDLVPSDEEGIEATEFAEDEVPKEENPKVDFGAIAKGGNQKALPSNFFEKLTTPSSKDSIALPPGLLGLTATTKPPTFGPNGSNIPLFKVPAPTLQPSNSKTDSPKFGSSTGAFDTNFTAGREIAGPFGANQPPKPENENSFLNAENIPITPGSSQGRRRADGKPLTRRAGQNKRNSNAVARARERESGA